MQYNIACVRSGNSKYKFYYVERLYDMLERNLTVPFKLFQFTDHPEDKDSKVENIDISKHGVETNSCWSKLTMFDHVKTNPIDDDFLYIDLDTVIIDNIDEFVTCRPKPNTITLLEYVGRNSEDRCRDKYGSHFMYISKGFGQSIWNNFSRNMSYHYKKYKTGDEKVIEVYTPKNRIVLWKNLIPSLNNKIVSILDPKVDWSETGRRDHKPYKETSILYCHGSPKLHHIAFGDSRFPDLTTPNWFRKAWNLEEQQQEKEDTLFKANIIDSKSQDKISIVTFKWNNKKLPKEYFVKGHATVPSEDKDVYGPDHVNKLYNMVKRNLKNIDFEFVLITDQSQDEDDLINDRIRIEPLWHDLREYGGCTHRLKLLSSEMKGFLRPRFVQMDLDMVVTGSLDKMFSRQDDFVIYGMRDNLYSKYKIPCNGSIWMNKTGTLSHLYDEYDFKEAQEAQKKYNFIGSDQLWFAYKLFQQKDLRGSSISTWTKQDGIYDFLSDIMRNTPGWNNKSKYAPKVKYKLPTDARLVTFPGSRDVSEKRLQDSAPWILKHWQ